ncbi:MAG: hypothetical protein KCHDKBKB_02354 [Elusimicrobia bacterium]|nr:hypothetical protein [Elusimicrobiota bacterium]
MWNTEIKIKNKNSTPFFLQRGFLMTCGITAIVVSFVVLGVGLYEGLTGGGRMKTLQLPGFQEVQLETPGLYAGVYRHRSTKEIPIKALTQLDVRVLSKEDYEEIPVLMNSGGQTFNRMGFQGMPLFNFAIARAGAYTISGVYSGGVEGPSVEILLIPQSAGNIKQTLVVTLGFFLFFLGLGIVILLRLDHLAPKKLVTKP